MKCIRCEAIVDEYEVKERKDGSTIKVYTACQCSDGGSSQREVARIWNSKREVTLPYHDTNDRYQS